MPTAPRPHRSQNTPTHAVYDRFRGSSSQRGYTRKWAAYAKAYLNDHPDCVMCGASATCVDHIKTIKEHPELQWEANNHQPLCHTCHSSKTCRHDGGFRNR